MAMAKTTTKPAPKAKSTKPVSNAELESRFKSKHSALVDFVENPTAGVSDAMLAAVRAHFEAFKAFAKQADREDMLPVRDQSSAWARKSRAEERALDALVSTPGVSPADSAFKAGYLLKWSPGQGMWTRPETGEALLRSMTASDPDAPILALARKWVRVYDDAYGRNDENLDDTPQMQELHILTQRMRTAKPVTAAGVAAKGLIDASFGDFAVEDATIDDMIRVSGVEPPSTMFHYYTSRNLPAPRPPLRLHNGTYVFVNDAKTDKISGAQVVLQAVDEMFRVNSNEDVTLPVSRIHVALDGWVKNPGDPTDEGVKALYGRLQSELIRYRALRDGKAADSECDVLGSLVYLMHEAIIDTPVNTARGWAIKTWATAMNYFGGDDYQITDDVLNNPAARATTRVAVQMLRATAAGPQISKNEIEAKRDWHDIIGDLYSDVRGAHHMMHALVCNLEFSFDRSRGRKAPDGTYDFTFSQSGLDQTYWLMDQTHGRLYDLVEKVKELVDVLDAIVTEAQKPDNATVERLMIVPVLKALNLNRPGVHEGVRVTPEGLVKA